MCAAHWIDKMIEEDRDALLQHMPMANCKFSSDSLDSFNLTIAQHLVVSGVLNTKGYQPEWVKPLLEQPVRSKGLPQIDLKHN